MRQSKKTSLLFLRVPIRYSPYKSFRASTADSIRNTVVADTSSAMDNLNFVVGRLERAAAATTMRGGGMKSKLRQLNFAPVRCYNTVRLRPIQESVRSTFVRANRSTL